jgi:Cu(I)/Ag(I) efflux system membrane protein CusA/SilA
VRKVPGASSAYAERVAGGYYVDIVPRREQLARYGLTIDMVQEVIATALGGEMVTTTVEGLERYGVSVRYARGLRDDPARLASEVFVPTMNGPIPLGQLAEVEADARRARHPHRERAAGRLCVCRHREADLGAFVKRAQQAVAEEVSSRRATTPPGAASSRTWSAPRRR